MSKKLWLTIFILISFVLILVSGTITGLFTSTIQSRPLVTEAEHHSPPPYVIEAGSGVEAASYIIFHDDETPKNYYAKSGSTGEIEFQSTNASYVIQSAIDALSDSGKIFIKAGTYTINATIYYTSPKLKFQGEGSHQTIIKAADNLNSDLFSFAGSNSEHYISFEDLKIDGNRANQNGNYYLLRLNRVTAKIKSLYLSNYGVAITYDGGSWGSIEVESCWLLNGWSYGINVVNARGIQILNNKVSRGTSPSGGIVFGSLIRGTGTTASNEFIVVSDNYIRESASSGNEGNPIHFKGNIHHATVANNVIRGKFNMGIHFIRSADGVYRPSDIVIDSNVIEGESPATNPIDVNGADDVVISNNVVSNVMDGVEQYGIILVGVGTRGIIADNIVHDTGWSGISASHSDLVLIHDNIVYNTNKVWTNRFAIRVIATGTENVTVRAYRNILFDNQETSTQTVGFQLEAHDVGSTIYATLFDNEIRGGTTTFYSLAATSGTVYRTIKRNIGFITENSGTETVANNDYISHGLADTPSVVTITPTAQRVTAVLDKNSTHFQVGLWDITGTAITTPEDVYWYAEV